MRRLRDDDLEKVRERADLDRRGAADDDESALS
jgi:hypothetical protein